MKFGIITSYGPLAQFWRAGNVVECRYCEHYAERWCGKNEERTEPEERCAFFSRAPGADDDVGAPFFPFGRPMEREILNEVRHAIRKLGGTSHPTNAEDAYRELERLGASTDLLSVVGTWGGTMDDAEVLDLLRRFNAGRPLRDEILEPEIPIRDSGKGASPHET